MAYTVDREEYDEHEYERMREKLDQCIVALDVLLQRPGFGVGPQTLGAEVEYFLVDDDGHPLGRNTEIHDAIDDDRLTKEVIRYNVESNLTPVALEGNSFDTMRREMDEIAGIVDQTAARHGGRTISIGTLPTLRSEDLGRTAVTDEARYHALDKRLRKMRSQPHQIDIAGEDHLVAQANDVSLEGANTSFQLHARVDPDRFVDLYNAAQIATAPVLAASGNSPFFLGHRLWEETRIALFKQSVDHRDEHLRRTQPPRVAFGRRWLQDSAIEIFAEAVRTHDPILPILSDEDPRAAVHLGKVPGLDELRMHIGSIWTWNRAIFDPNADGHLRVEFRALPAGPTAVDMVANGAFVLGLTLAISDDASAWTRLLSFDQARDNFYAAARHGLDATLVSPFADGALQPRSARDLALDLLEPAQRALTSRGAEQLDELFAVLEERIGTGRTGAQWQRAAAAALEPRLGWDRALAAMTRRYVDGMASGAPVHTWPLPPG